MGANAKKKTTMAKLNRESKLRERRLLKKAKKDARKLAAAADRAAQSDGSAPTDPAGGNTAVGDPATGDDR